MITFANNLFLSEKIADKNMDNKYVEKLKMKIETHAGIFGACFICMASNEKDVFDIIPPYVFKQKAYTDEDIFIVGIADSKETAFDFVKTVTEEYLENGNGVSMREFYLEKCK